MLTEQKTSMVECQRLAWDQATSEYIKNELPNITQDRSFPIRGITITLGIPTTYQDPTNSTPHLIFTRTEDFTGPMQIKWQYQGTDQQPISHLVGETIMKTQPIFSLNITPNLSPIDLIDGISKPDSHPDIYRFTPITLPIREGRASSRVC